MHRDNGKKDGSYRDSRDYLGVIWGVSNAISIASALAIAIIWHHESLVRCLFQIDDPICKSAMIDNHRYLLQSLLLGGWGVCTNVYP